MSFLPNLFVSIRGKKKVEKVEPAPDSTQSTFIVKANDVTVEILKEIRADADRAAMGTVDDLTAKIVDDLAEQLLKSAAARGSDKWACWSSNRTLYRQEGTAEYIAAKKAVEHFRARGFAVRDRIVRSGSARSWHGSSIVLEWDDNSLANKDKGQNDSQT